MPDANLITLFKSSPDEWNAFRLKSQRDGYDLREANLSNLDLRGRILIGCNFFRANFTGSNLSGCKMQSGYFHEATFTGANLSKANLLEANLCRARVNDAVLRETVFSDANLTDASFRNSDLEESFLYKCQLVRTDFSGANLRGCKIYGSSVWDISTDGAVQQDILITRLGEPELRCDNLEVAQFLHLIINNSKLRSVIDTVTSKVVLILGRFSETQLTSLRNFRGRLRLAGYVPVLFDFEKPSNRDLTETVLTIANLAKFVVADISEPRSIPQELMAISGTLRSVIVQPVIHFSEQPYGMLDDLLTYPNFLPIIRYESLDTLDVGQLLGTIEQHGQSRSAEKRG